MRHSYSDWQKAKAYAILVENAGNVKRTAREMNMPPSTIRKWKSDWEAFGPPKPVPEPEQEDYSDFINHAIRVRGKLLVKLEDLTDGGSPTMAQVSTALGILSDKIRAAEATQERVQVDHKLVLPPADELRELFSGVVGGMIAAAQTRAAEIEAIEEPAVTTYRALPVAEES